MDSPKSTSFGYGRQYQLKQAEKYRARANNHWKTRIDLSKSLAERFCSERLSEKPVGETVVVDVGCSIGTFAIEFAKMGYKSYGIDFDSTALEIARELAQEEHVSPEFVCGDISEWTNRFPKIDIAICFDIFEHLHDDELGAFLSSIRRQLSGKGVLIFHTFPTQYDNIFFGKGGHIKFIMKQFRKLSPTAFNKLTKIFSALLDIRLLLKNGLTYKESIKTSSHCNPTTLERLSDILQRAGFDILFIESANIYDINKKEQEQFTRQPITHRNLYGAAIPKSIR